MLSRTEIEKGFALIENAALVGERAPTNISMDNPDGTLRSGITSALLKERRIKVEVYAHNWRVIELLNGPNVGKRTKECPHKHNGPYKVLPRDDDQ